LLFCLELLNEYNYLLSNQLDKQRMYFQSQIRCLEIEQQNQQILKQKSYEEMVEKKNYLQKRLM
jgi:hypothetical protein